MIPSRSCTHSITHPPPTYSFSFVYYIQPFFDFFSCHLSPSNLFFALFSLNHLLLCLFSGHFRTGPWCGVGWFFLFSSLPRDGLDRRLTRYVCSVLFGSALRSSVMSLFSFLFFSFSCDRMQVDALAVLLVLFSF